MISDKEIILKIKNGQIDYFEYLVKKYTQKIYQLIKSKISLKEDAEDLTQNTFIKFYKAIDRFNENQPILPYLYQIARNELKMFFRSRKQMLPLEEWYHLDADRFIDGIDDKEKYLKNLKREEKEMLLMIVDGYSYQEVAKRFKRPLNTVKSIIRRAKIKLKIESQKSKVNEKT